MKTLSETQVKYREPLTLSPETGQRNNTVRLVLLSLRAIAVTGDGVYTPNIILEKRINPFFTKHRAKVLFLSRLYRLQDFLTICCSRLSAAGDTM